MGTRQRRAQHLAAGLADPQPEFLAREVLINLQPQHARIAGERDWATQDRTATDASPANLGRDGVTRVVRINHFHKVRNMLL